MNQSSRLARSAWFSRLNRLVDFSPVIVALVLALVVASVLLLALNANPLEAYAAMWEGAAGKENATAETLVKATPILFVGIGITIAFRGGMINIGGEGPDDRRRTGRHNRRLDHGRNAHSRGTC